MTTPFPKRPFLSRGVPPAIYTYMSPHNPFKETLYSQTVSLANFFKITISKMANEDEASSNFPPMYGDAGPSIPPLSVSLEEVFSKIYEL